MKIILFSIFATLFYTCHHKGNEKLPKSGDNFKLQIPKDTNTLYYPSDKFFFVSDTNNKASDLFAKSMYSEILFNLHEPVLYNYKGNAEVVRLLWIRPFDNPVVVSQTRLNDIIQVSIKELGKKYYNNDSFNYQMNVDTTFTIPVDKQNYIFSNTEIDIFFASDANDTLRDDNYKDVTTWVLEGIVRGKYHSVNKLYLDSSSLNSFPTAKKLYDIGNHILSMKSSREY